jgi:uncharacterized lipoprotein (TIGR02269 family)
MGKRLSEWLWLLLVSGVLAGCAGVPHSVGQGEAGCEQEAASFEEVCQQESSLLALCEGRQCAAYRCREVAEYFSYGQVVRTQAVVRPPPRPPGPPPRPPTEPGIGTGPEPGTDAWRNWGSAQKLPWQLQPVFIIPWGDTSPPLLKPGVVELWVRQEGQRDKPYERHHIYPQEQELKKWFERKGINIHQWTLALEIEEHRRIHRGPNGGAWNEAWRRFKRANEDATKQEIELHAGKLIYEFNLYGVVVPYRRQLLRVPSNLLDAD